MTWEETIVYIRTQPEFKELVELAYFDEDLQLNVERFRDSVEFSETLKIIKKYKQNTTSILDIGCGNGITSIAFSMEGYNVTAVEPDPSETVGAGAVRKLKNQYKLKNIDIRESFAENIGLADKSFDVVYARQSMHHAKNLNVFINECARVLKKDGILITTRDHVIFDNEDKMRFLQNHPLQKYYGGENAFTLDEYEAAFYNAGLILLKTLKTFDSEINYYPMSPTIVKKGKIKQQLGLFLLLFPFINSDKIKKKINNILNEKDYPGRMYSFIAVKK